MLKITTSTLDRVPRFPVCPTGFKLSSSYNHMSQVLKDKSQYKYICILNSSLLEDWADIGPLPLFCAGQISLHVVSALKSQPDGQWNKKFVGVFSVFGYLCGNLSDLLSRGSKGFLFISRRKKSRGNSHLSPLISNIKHKGSWIYVLNNFNFFVQTGSDLLWFNSGFFRL